MIELTQGPAERLGVSSGEIVASGLIAALVWWQKVLAVAGGLLWLWVCVLAMREGWRAFVARDEERKRREEREPRWRP